MLFPPTIPVRAVTLLVVSIVLSTPVAAQTGSDASKTLDALAECEKLPTDSTKLVCFQSAAREIAAARKSGKLLALDRDNVVERRRQRFGLAHANQSPLDGGKADRDTMVTEIHTTITRAKPASYARFTLQLANNTVWETIEPLKTEPRPGTAIVIKQSGFGGLKATISGERPVLVKRQR